MAEKTTFIKLDRNILDWGWYRDGNTFRIFLHLLLTANIKPHMFLGVEIKRGEVATSYSAMSETLGISIRSVRTAISHLKSTGEVTIKRHPHFTVISIPNYDSYQANRQSNRLSADHQLTIDRQQSKNDKKEKNIYIQKTLNDYGGVFLSDEDWVELEAMVGDAGEFLEVIDRVGEWLRDNPRPKEKHKTIVKTFLRNDGYELRKRG